MTRVCAIMGVLGREKNRGPFFIARPANRNTRRGHCQQRAASAKLPEALLRAPACLRSCTRNASARAPPASNAFEPPQLQRPAAPARFRAPADASRTYAQLLGTSVARAAPRYMARLRNVVAFA